MERGYGPFRTISSLIETLTTANETRSHAASISTAKSDDLFLVVYLSHCAHGATNFTNLQTIT